MNPVWDVWFEVPIVQPVEVPSSSPYPGEELLPSSDREVWPDALKVDVTQGNEKKKKWEKQRTKDKSRQPPKTPRPPQAISI